MGGNRLRITPCFEEVMIRADSMDVRTRLVAAVREGNRKRYFVQPVQEVAGVGIVVTGVHTIKQQRVNLAAIQVFHKFSQRGIVSGTLQRRLGEVQSLAYVVEKGIKRVNQDLDR